MEVTNILGLPDVLVDIIKNDSYGGKGKLTATTLIDHPHLFALKNQNESKIKVDVVDQFHTLLGKSVHYLFEKAGHSYITEQRFFTTIKDPRLQKEYEISAQIDIFKMATKKLTDIKVITKYRNGLKFEYEAQLNIQVYCMQNNNIPVDSAELLHIYRDWHKKDKYDHQLPSYPINSVQVPIWDRQRTHDFIVERLLEFEKYDGGHCDPESRWARPDVYALMKPGATRSRKNCATEQEAYANQKPGEIIDFRPGIDARCADYCDVNVFCPYYIKKYLIKA